MLGHSYVMDLPRTHESWISDELTLTARDLFTWWVARALISPIFQPVHTFASNRSQLSHLETFDQAAAGYKSFSPPGSRPVSKVDLEENQVKLNKVFLGDNLTTLKVGAYSD